MLPGLLEMLHRTLKMSAIPVLILRPHRVLPERRIYDYHAQ
jgi:hypothetical protein